MQSDVVYIGDTRVFRFISRLVQFLSWIVYSVDLTWRSNLYKSSQSNEQLVYRHKQIFAVVICVQLSMVPATNFIACEKPGLSHNPCIYLCYGKDIIFLTFLYFCRLVLRMFDEVLEHRYYQLWSKELKRFWVWATGPCTRRCSI